MIWENSFGGRYFESGTGIANGVNGNLAVGGNVNSLDQDVSGHFGGVDTSDFWLVSVSDSLTSSISSHPKEEGAVHIYPNPTSRTVTEDLKADASIRSLKLMDAQGRVYRSVKDGPFHSLDVSGLRRGAYFLKEHLRKLIIE